MTRNDVAFEIMKLFISDLKWRPNAMIQLEGEEEPRKASDILCEDSVAYADKLMGILESKGK